jgi:hypothetical protein
MGKIRPLLGYLVVSFFFFFCEYIVKKPREREQTYGIKKVEGEYFPIHGGKDVDKGEMMGM